MYVPPSSSGGQCLGLSVGVLALLLAGIAGQARPVHRTIQNCSIHFQGVGPNNSQRDCTPVLAGAEAPVPAARAQGAAHDLRNNQGGPGGRGGG